MLLQALELGCLVLYNLLLDYWLVRKCVVFPLKVKLSHHWIVHCERLLWSWNLERCLTNLILSCRLLIEVRIWFWGEVWLLFLQINSTSTDYWRAWTLRSLRCKRMLLSSLRGSKVRLHPSLLYWGLRSISSGLTIYCILILHQSTLISVLVLALLRAITSWVYSINLCSLYYAAFSSALPFLDCLIDRWLHDFGIEIPNLAVRA